jgi:two-component system, LytTR family, sensor kinase
MNIVRMSPPVSTSPLPLAPAMSLRACLTIATIFFTYVSITITVRWELMRQATESQAGFLRADVIALNCVLMFPVLWIMASLSWRAGYDLTRWRRLLLINLGLGLVFGLFSRPGLIVSAALLRDMPVTESLALLDGKNPVKAVKLWTAAIIEDAAQYLVLQGIIAGAAFYLRARAEQSLRERFAAEYDRARLQALRMQTNPHFLFNALSAIAGLIRTRPDSAESMVTGLGELFRATLVDRDVEFVTLRRELDLGKQYLDIQRARFDDRFVYRIEAPPEVSQVLVPPLLLQPLLENAAEHGLSEREGIIEVTVTCSLVGDRLHVTVTNQADARPRATGAPARGFGLENVQERLRAAFGDSARFTTEHTSAGVFEARIEFPARTGMQRGS